MCKNGNVQLDVVILPFRSGALQKAMDSVSPGSHGTFILVSKFSDNL